MTAKAETERTEAIEQLRSRVKPGDTLFTVLRSVSRSGMSRNISVILNSQDGPYEISGQVARAIGWSQAKDGSVRTGGAGMDMGFHIVNTLSYKLYPTYECVGDSDKYSERCPSSTHVNSGPDRDKFSGTHKDGYALKQRWL